MASVPKLLADHPRAMAVHGVLAVAGAVFLVDGILRGEPRHQAAAVVLGLALAAPLAGIAVGGARVLALCNRLVLSAGTLAALLLGLEAFVRIADVRAFSHAEVVRDPILGHVHVPNRGPIDGWGHRNVRVPERADVVCIGDSQTFGTSVRRAESYPSQLAVASALEVYSMGLGGYGPLQYAVLAARSLTLDPKVVVIGWYFGNDIADAHRFLGLEHWAELRDPELEYTLPMDVEHGDRRSLNLAMAVADRLMLHSRVLRTIGSELKSFVKSNGGLFESEGAATPGAGYRGPAIATRYTPVYRMGCMDLSNRNMRDGLRVARHCFDELRRTFDGTDARPVLLLIHNKEFYYREFLRRRDAEVPPILEQLARLETALQVEVVELADAAGMSVIDPTDALVDALASGVAIYPSDTDGHLNREGCRVLAEALWRAIEPLVDDAR